MILRATNRMRWLSGIMYQFRRKLAMLLETSQDVRDHTIKVDLKLPLSEQIHFVNDALCYEAKTIDICILEKIEVRNGYRFLHYRLWRNYLIEKDFAFQ